MRYGFISALLFAGCLSLAVVVEPRLTYNPAYDRYEGSAVEIAVGDAQRLFASQFYTKADVYMHRGFYPSIFDSKEEFESSHSGALVPRQQVEKREPDWIERFSRSFYPSQHTHLGSDEEGEEECDDPEHHHEEGHDHEKHEEEEETAEVREILPWLKAAAELDPNREETFVTGAYWLRTRLERPKEAEEFLRDGLRANPGSYSILFELGKLFEESYQDDERARNVFEVALRRWRQQESVKEEPDILTYGQIVWHLALLEERGGNIPKAIHYLEMAKAVSHNPGGVDERIQELKKTSGNPGQQTGEVR